MLKRLVVFFLIWVVAAIFSPVRAEEKVNLHLFYSKGCPHCSKEKLFLDNLKQRYNRLSIYEYEVSDQKNVELLIEVGKTLGADVRGVPFTVIGEKYISGYMNDQTTGRQIENLIVTAISQPTKDLVTDVKNKLGAGGPAVTKEITVTMAPRESETGAAVVSPSVSSPIEFKQEVVLNLPILGTVSATSLSLPILTVVIALLDGFNPCAMWVLLFLISMLLGVKDRRRMWLLGTTFIVASGVVYFLFLSAWLNLFMFLGLVAVVRLVVGVFAVGVGGYQLKEYFVNKNGGCKVVNDSRRGQIFDRIRRVVGEKRLGLALLGMVLLAGAVNLIELICSAGLPAIYTHVLSMSQLPVWQYYLLLLLYMVIFLLDDLIVFFVAMTSLKLVGIENKYSRLTHLVGGGLILVLGILMLFKPEWLMFG